MASRNHLSSASAGLRRSAAPGVRHADLTGVEPFNTADLPPSHLSVERFNTRKILCGKDGSLQARQKHEEQDVSFSASTTNATLSDERALLKAKVLNDSTPGRGDHAGVRYIRAGNAWRHAGAHVAGFADRSAGALGGAKWETERNKGEGVERFNTND